MIKISNVTPSAKSRLQLHLNEKDLQFTEFECDGDILYSLEVKNAIVKLYSHDSSIVIDIAGQMDILSCEEYGELRFC